MANDLAGYRTDIDALLATAVDSSTWTTAIKDQALRMALGDLNNQLVYEVDFTVVSADHEQDLSTITAINAVLGVAYPWIEGSEFGRCAVEWRFSGVNKVYLIHSQPAVGETIRVRYSKLHVIDDLDSATATTVPDMHRLMVGLWAAAHACDLRVRQISENPATPKEAWQLLKAVAMEFRKRADNALSHVPPISRVRWGSIGLD